MGTSYTEPPVNPPRSAMIATGLSAVASGVVASGATGSSLMVAFWTVAFFQSREGSWPTQQGNVPLAAGLMLAAVVFAGLALLLTLLGVCGIMADKSAKQVETPTSPGPLTVYTSLNLLALSVDALGLNFLARGVSGCHLAAIIATLLQILALAVGASRWMARRNTRS